MSGFAEFAVAAQTGVRRSPPTLVGPLGLEPGETATLAELGALGLMQRAGAIAPPLTSLIAAPDESLRIAQTAAEPLQEALDFSAPLIAAWAAEAARRGFVAPPSVLTRLIPRARKSPEIRRVLGARGRWLAARMEIEIEEEADALPAKEEYDALDWRDRQRLIAGLDEEDMELFEKALVDGRREVRDAAAERLVRIAASPSARGLRDLASRAVVVRKGLLGPSLHVAPPSPDDLPPWLPRGVAQSGMGPAALALRDLLAHVPPSTWSDPPGRLLVLARKGEDEKGLLEGWYEAALRFDDVAWIDALLVYHATHGSFVPPALVRRASEGAFEAAVLDRLRGKESIETKIRPFFDRGRLLSPGLSRAVVEALRAGGAGYHWIDDLANVLDFSVVPMLDEPWGEESRPEELRLRWRKIFDLRRRLLESLR